MNNKNKNPYYINKKILLKEIIECKQNDNILSKELEKMLIKICQGVVSKMTYWDKDDRKDCLSTAYLKVFDNWYKFDETRFDNPFAYISEIAKRGMAFGWNEIHNSKSWKTKNKVASLNLHDFNDE